MTTSRYALSFGLAAALAAVAIAPASAAPVLSNTVAVKSAASDSVTDVRWRRGGAVAAGIGAGIALGAIAASQPRYYDPYYGSYGYGPTYVAPAPTYYGGYHEPYYAPAPAYGYGYYGYPESNRYYRGRADTNAAGNW
jgi:hypothetical protein